MGFNDEEAAAWQVCGEPSLSVQGDFDAMSFTMATTQSPKQVATCGDSVMTTSKESDVHEKISPSSILGDSDFLAAVEDVHSWLGQILDY